MKSLLTVATLGAMLFFAGCGEKDIDVLKKHNAEVVSALPGERRLIVVEQTERTSRENLVAIAKELNATDPNEYQITVIEFLLEGEGDELDCWATARFDPDLELTISDQD